MAIRTLNNSKTHDIHPVSVKCYKQEVEGIDFLDTFTAPNIRRALKKSHIPYK